MTNRSLGPGVQRIAGTGKQAVSLRQLIQQWRGDVHHSIIRSSQLPDDDAYRVRALGKVDSKDDSIAWNDPSVEQDHLESVSNRLVNVPTCAGA
jgi:hypothetical protein